MTDQNLAQRRRIWYLIINRDFQFKFTSYFVAMIVSSLVLIWLTIRLVFQKNLIQLKEDPLLVDVLKNVLSGVDYFFIWEGVLIVSLSVVLALVVSRAIAGPLFRIEKDLRDFNRNPDKIREIRIRDYDYCQGLVKELNEVFEKLARR